MSDFERRLRDALGEGAESAPEAQGLAEGARRRLRKRRRRLTTAGAVVAVVAVAVPVGLLGSEGDHPGRPADNPVTSALENQRVGCAGPAGLLGSASWPVWAMDGGVPGLVDDAEVRAAFEQAEQAFRDAPTEAPQAIREQGVDRVPYVALAKTPEAQHPTDPHDLRIIDDYTLGVGTWTASGPGDDAGLVVLERQEDGSLRVEGWTTECELQVAVPDGRSPVVIKAPRGGVDGSTTRPVVMVNELACTSGRNPVPFLGEPRIVEDDERVLVTMTTEAVEGAARCQGNPSVPVTLNLDEPIGDRELLDGGTWPPTPLKIAADEGWHTVEYEGVLVDVPSDWERLDTSSCEWDGLRYGPPGSDPCSYVDESLNFYGSATFDPKFGPGLRRDEEFDGWAGHVGTGDWAVYVKSKALDEARRILGSARVEGQQPADVAAGWRTESYGGLSLDVPASWRQGGLGAWCLDESVPGWVQDPKTTVRAIHCGRPRSWYGARFGDATDAGSPWAYAQEQTGGSEYPDGAWVGHLRPQGANGQVTVAAPTQALAELILGSVRKE